MSKFTGGCLCGSAKYQVEGDVMIAGDCYCVDCRKSSGTSHGTHVALPDDKFEATGNVTTYDHPADSGNVVSRSFCPTCGSALYSTNSGMPGSVFLRASSLDDLDAITLGMSVYTSRAPKWARINPDAPSFPDMMPAEEMPFDTDG